MTPRAEQIRVCEQCGERYSRASLAHPIGDKHWAQRRFCSAACRKAALRPTEEKTCSECGSAFSRAERRHSDEQWAARLTCGPRCQAARARRLRQGPGNPSWAGDSPTSTSTRYTRAQKAIPEVEPCEDCATEQRIHRHHKDKNTLNNDPTNIAFLCVRCHAALHAREKETPHGR